jgi:ankyrin repeat protein
VPLILAACFNRVELIELLLAHGADIETTEIWGITPLVSALYHGAREAADVLSARKIVPQALWVVAASGHDELLERFFAADGELRPQTGAHRPNLADVGWPPAPPRGDEPEVILAEALVASCHNGRERSAVWLLDTGVDVDARPYLGLTGLHLAVQGGYLHLVELLVERGADLTLRDEVHHQTPLQWAERLAERDFTSAEIRDYLRERA